MKKRLLVFAIAVAIVSFGASATLAQVPNFQIFFDKALTKTEANCPAAPVGTVFDTLHVVALNCNAWLSAAEFMIAYPASITHTGDIMLDGALQIGNSASGISLAYPIPVDALSGPAVLMRASFVWMCNDCSVTNIPIDILPYPVSGLVTYVTWPDLTMYTAVGMRALICSTVAAEETNWGRIKALYEE